MIIEKLQISNVRNLEDVVLFPSPSINFIIGSNGSGKSSLIEAISLITSARSFRTKKSSRIVRSDKSSFTIFAKISAGLTHYRVGLNRESELNQFKIRINQEPIHKASILASYFPQLTISPEQCDLVDGSPERRRSFIDWSLFHVKHDYNELISNYKKTLSQRNKILRTRNGSKLDHWDKVLCNYAEQIDKYRRDLFDQVLQTLKQEIANKFKVSFDINKLNINYSSGWKSGISLEEALINSREQDIDRGFTHQGPHRADFKISLDGVPIREILSRGEKKVLQVLLTVAQLIHFRKQMSVDPIILMDDIFAELDVINIELLFNLVRDLQLQLFVSATDLINIEAYVQQGEKLFHVKQGLLTEMVQ
ncbi:MAG: DNA replication/repair protein RecF [Chromatiales bacterium]|nr:DNA replication/repair protein RecF [Chromatiales bacterium]